ncbi:MAG TPA: hypothetical protein VFX85_02665 [Solirubrobacterales bacterium]|nr:hypothetical protein [Solirubrobacterales bacterium]
MTWLKTVRLGTLLAAAFLLAGVLFPSLSSGYAIVPGSVQIQTLDKEGNPSYRAGSHPDRMILDFELAEVKKTGPRDFRFDFEPGLAGAPNATPICPRVEFEINTCPQNTEVGRFTTQFGGLNESLPIYNIQPVPGSLATLAFKLAWQTELEMRIRPKDFGVTLITRNLVQLPLEKAHVEIYGVPGDHNGSGDQKPFMTMPTDCSPLRFTFHTRSWEPNAPFISEESETPAMEDCQSLPFKPSLDLDVTNPKPDSPTGLGIDLNLEQNTGADARESTGIKDARIDLPPGLTMSPAGAEGREFCEDSQFGLGEETPVACPFRSSVGSVKMTTPALDQDLTGSVYIGRERPGERFPLFVSASAPGVGFKAAAQLIANPDSGNLSVALKNLPKFPVEQISLDLEGGPRALLATPLSCGQALGRAHFVPYSGSAPVDSTTPIEIGGSCPNPLPFGNDTSAGSMKVEAGKDASFSLIFKRQDGEQLAKKFSTTLPPGVSPDLTVVDPCPSAKAATGNCPESTKIGNTVVEVGSGPNPAKVFGSVFLSDGYEGSPLGMTGVFRLKIGPFDLGTLVLPVTLRLDPVTGQVLLTHPLPTIFEGVTLRFRTLKIDIFRSGFLNNPTSCEPQEVTSSIVSLDGRTATTKIPFQVKGCDNLGFKPKFSVALNQRGKFAKSPQLSFAASIPGGEANLKRLKVGFAKGLKFHNAALKEICPRASALEDHCGPAARVGTAVANTPRVEESLTGPVYVVQPAGGGFPELWSIIEGGGVKLELRSKSAGKKGNLTTEILDIPDLPLGNFEMRIDAGPKKNALFTVTKGLCGSPDGLATPVELEGQNGMTRTVNLQMKAGCSKKKAGGKKGAPGKGKSARGGR